MKRTQIYLDEKQDRAIAARATASGTTKSAVIRHAVDAYLEQPQEQKDWKTAIAELSAELKRNPVHFEPDLDGAAYVDYLGAIEFERDKELGWVYRDDEPDDAEPDE